MSDKSVEHGEGKEPQKIIDWRSPFKKFFGRKAPKQPASQKLTVSNPEESVEFPLPKMKVPRSLMDPKEEATEEQLKEFFTPEVMQRLIYCPKINVDETDDMGYFGYEQGYIFVEERNYNGKRTFSDEALLSALNVSFKGVKTKSGAEIQEISHYDFFPRNKFQILKITPSREPRTFAFLRETLEDVDPNDLSTYLIDDLDREMRGVMNKFSYVESLPEQIKKSQEDVDRIKLDNPAQASDVAKIVEILEQRYKKEKDQLPQTMKRYLELINEAQKRKEITNSGMLMLNGQDSLEEQQKAIDEAIQKAAQQGNEGLSSELKKLSDETANYRKEGIYAKNLPLPTDKKLLE